MSSKIIIISSGKRNSFIDYVVVEAMRSKKPCAPARLDWTFQNTDAYKTGSHLMIRRGRSNRHFFETVVA